MSGLPDSPINRYPASLLGFLDIKAMGNNPRYIEPNVRPILDLHPFYMGGSRVGASGLVAITSGAIFPANLTVPSSKAWIVDHVSLTGPGLVTGEVLYACPLIQPVAGVGLIGPRVAEVGDTTASPIFVASWDLSNRPIVCPSGYRFGAFVFRENLGALNLTVGVSYVEADF